MPCMRYFYLLEIISWYDTWPPVWCNMYSACLVCDVIVMHNVVKIQFLCFDVFLKHIPADQRQLFTDISSGLKSHIPLYIWNGWNVNEPALDDSVAQGWAFIHTKFLVGQSFLQITIAKAQKNSIVPGFC